MTTRVESRRGLPGGGRPTDIQEDVWIKSACNMCYTHCGIRAHRVNGVLVRIEGDPEHPHNWGKLCAKGHAGVMAMYNPNRVKVPLKRGNPEKGLDVDPKWQEISWSEALDTITKRLEKIRAEDPRRLGVSTWDVNYSQPMVPPWLAGFGGATRLFLWGVNCGAVLHQVTFLTNGSFHQEIDFDYCNYCLLLGCNRGFGTDLANPLMAQKMADARSRGMRVVVVDPIMNMAAAKADEWVPIRPGTDAALVLAMLNVIVNELGLYDADFLKRRTNAPYLINKEGLYVRDRVSHKPLVWDVKQGAARPFDAEVEDYALEGSYTVAGTGEEGRPAFALFKEHIKKYTPEMASEITSVPAGTISRIAREFAEAAKIGATLVLEGKELPYRPAAAMAFTGVHAHKHGTMAGLAVQMLDMIVGNFEVPGGYQAINAVGPTGYHWSWKVEPSADGLVSPYYRASTGFDPYAAKVEKPDSYSLHELHPLGHMGGYPQLVLEDREKFGVTFDFDTMINARTNPVLDSLNTDEFAKNLTKIPFIVDFAIEPNETTAFADIVLPDTHGLERYCMIAQHYHLAPLQASGHFYWGINQPVVPPPEGCRNWFEVMVEIADRMGFLGKFCEFLNLHQNFKEPSKLASDKQYTFEEILDVWARSWFGPDRGLAWFKEHGFLKTKRTLEERYPGPSMKARVPLYFEYFLELRRDVEEVSRSIGIDSDLESYRPLPDFIPCPAFLEKSSEYDLTVVNYKIPIHYQGFTVENPWLSELGDYHPTAYRVLINSDVAAKKGIKDGDWIWIESKYRRAKGRAKLTQRVHPEVVGMAGKFGSWEKGKPIGRNKGVQVTRLMNMDLEHLEGLSGVLDRCVKVKVYKA